MGVDEGYLLVMGGVERYILTSRSYGIIPGRNKVKLNCTIRSRIGGVSMKEIY